MSASIEALSVFALLFLLTLMTVTTFFNITRASSVDYRAQAYMMSVYRLANRLLQLYGQLDENEEYTLHVCTPSGTTIKIYREYIKLMSQDGLLVYQLPYTVSTSVELNGCADLTVSRLGSDLHLSTGGSSP